MSVGYYTRKAGSQVMKPLQVREQQKQAMSDDIYKRFTDQNISSSEALEILSRVRNKVIACQGVMDRNYYRRREG